MCAIGWPDHPIRAICSQFAGIDGIAEVRIEHDVPQVPDELRESTGAMTSTRRSKLRSIDVGAPDVHTGFAVVVEVVDTAVLQESADEADHTDSFADARHTGPQATDAANDELYFHAGPRRRVEGADRFLVHQ